MFFFYMNPWYWIENRWYLSNTGAIKRAMFYPIKVIFLKLIGGITFLAVTVLQSYTEQNMALYRFATNRIFHHLVIIFE